MEDKGIRLFDASASMCGDRSKLHNESTYVYWRDSERPSMNAIRDLLESWFSEIPSDHRLDVQQRFRSPIERQHRSAVFEIFLQHFLLRCGFEVEFHPNVDGVKTRPDFLVSKQNSALFYLEAIAVFDSQSDGAEKKRIAQVYDTLGTLNSPDFYIGIQVDGAPGTPPPAARLRHDLEVWLSSLDWREVRHNYASGSYANLPMYEWNHNGWKVTFEPIPKSESSRGTKSVQPIASIMPMQAVILKLNEKVKRAVIKKDRYGSVKLPLVVAVQVVHDFGIKEIDVMDALLGEECIEVDHNHAAQATRLANGAWFSPTGPRHRNISAVLAWPTLDPWTFAAAEPIIVHHPYAAYPLPKDSFPLTQYVFDDVKRVLAKQDGFSMADILALKKDWLPED